MKYKNVNIGELIRNRFDELAMKKVSFATQLGIQRQNVDKSIFSRKSLDTELLCRVGEILDYDFLAEYKDNSVNIGRDYAGGNIEHNGTEYNLGSDAVMAEKVRALEAMVAEKDERIKDLKERIEELKAR